MIVQNVFDQAIHLMDAQNESTGSTTTADTKEYALRTPNIINTLLDQVYPYSGTYPSVEDGSSERPFLPSVSSLEHWHLPAIASRPTQLVQGWTFFQGG